MNDDVIVFDTGASIDVPPAIDKKLELVPETDPILKEVMPEFNFEFPPVDANALASALVETCKENQGIGLSANQCGLRYRVFVMGAGDEYVAFFNPKVLSSSEDTVHMEEGCLSFPLLGLRITRPAHVEVEYQDFTGATKYARFSGISARCFLHELDHMNGILYTDRVKPLALESGKKKRQKLLNNIMNHGSKLKEAYTYR